jgi:hypothetical protein
MEGNEESLAGVELEQCLLWLIACELVGAHADGSGWESGGGTGSWHDSSENDAV